MLPWEQQQVLARCSGTAYVVLLLADLVLAYHG